MLKYLYKYIIISCIILLQSYCHSGCCQNLIFDSQQISTAEGLNSRFVLDIEKDHDGQLWIGTNKGFLKFNGHRINQLSEDHSLNKNRSFSFFIVDKQGLIWRVYRKNDLNRIHNKKEIDSLLINHLQYTEIEVSIFNPNENSTISFDDFFKSQGLKIENVWDIKETEFGILINCADQIFLYNQNLEEVCIPENLEDRVFYVNKINKNQLIFSIKNEIQIYDTNCNFIKTIERDTIARTLEIYIDQNEGIWILKRIHEIYYLKYFKDINSKPKRSENFFEIHPALLNNLEVYNLGEDLLLVRFKRKFAILEKSNLREVKLDEFTNIFKDKNIAISDIDKNSSNFTLATSEGLYFITPKPKKFKTHFKVDNSVISMRGITEDHDEYLIANSYSGLQYQKGSIIHKVDNNSFLLFGLALYYDRFSHKIYKGHHSSNITIYDIEKNVISNHNIDLKTDTEIQFFIRSETSKKLYVGTQTGLYELDKNQTPKFIENINEILRSNKPNLTGVLEKDSLMWITNDSGLLSFNTITNNVDMYSFENDSISFNYLSHLYIENDSTFWLASAQDGLLKWNKNKNTYNIYNTQNGLSNDIVHAVYANKNNLWISTNLGLNSLDLKTNKIKSFYEKDGISDNEFNRFSHYQNENGTIYFGSINGITEIHQNQVGQIVNDTIKVGSVIFEIKNKDDEIRRITYEENNFINFYPSDKNIKIIIIPSSLFRSENNTYLYKLKHLGNTWQETNQNEINFANLPYGELTLELKINRLGQNRNSDILAVQIFSDKPYYLKIPFICITSLLLIGFGLWLVKIRTNYLLQKQAKLEAIISDRTSELREMNEVKRKLFSVLAHDIRNPIASLTNITTKVQYLIAKNEPETLEKLTVQIDSKLHNLNRNLDNILNWALADDKKIPYNPNSIDLKKQCLDIFSLYTELLAKRKLRYKILSDDTVMVFFDETAIQTILRNLIHNAIKFSPLEESISISIKQKNDHYLSLEIKNKNSTVEENRRRNKKGMGLGLNIVRELALLNKGTFSIQNDKTNNYFIGILTLPLSNQKGFKN